MLFGLNFRQWFLMILFGAVHLLHGSIYTLQAPFYPSEAQHKGATASQYGTVFGIYEFAIFVACPLVGSIAMPKFGAKFMLYFGIVLQGTTTVIFGFLDKVNNLTLFLSFSLGLRILEAIGFASSFVSLYSFVPSQFPNHIPLVYGVLEMSNGIGLSMGPGIGGLLYNLGGFLLPFLTIGIVILACLLVVVPALSSTTITVDPGEADRGVISLLKIPAVSINFFAILLQTTLLSFLYANFAEYLRIQFGLTPPTIGTIFCAFGLFHALLSPLWGYLLGKLPSPHYIILAGAILDFVGLVLVGPIPYLGIEPSLNLTCTGVFIFAIAHGSLMIAAFINAAIEAKAHDFPDDANTAGLVSGCFMGAYSLGGAVGPPVSGALYDAFGFRIAELFVAGSALFLVIVLSAYAIVSKCGSRGKTDVNNPSEESALLANTNNLK